MPSLSALSARSWSAATGEVTRAALDVSIVAESGVVLGCFQRECDAPGAAFHRASGGGALVVGPGTVHVTLALEAHDTLVSCSREQILNRHVRPLLRGLTKAGALAHYFGRDWVSVGHRPAGFLGFAHHAESGRTSFEALVGVTAPLWTAPGPSHEGKAPASLSELAGRTLDPARVADSIRAAYEQAFGALPPLLATASSVPVTRQPSWRSRVDEAIGALRAGRDEAGALRLGGELMASRDAVARLEASLVGASSEGDDLARRVDEALGAPGVALFGVRSLDSVREVLARAHRDGQSR